MGLFRREIADRPRRGAVGRWLAAGCLLIVSLGGPDFARWSTAHASTFVALTMAELLARSTSVAVVTPLDSRSVWEETAGGHGRRIVTYTRVKVVRMVDGAALDETWVRTLGGRVGDIGQHVEGDAVLIPQRTVLLFLVALPDGPHAVVGMGQGQYPLEPSNDGLGPRLMPPSTSGRLLQSPTPSGPPLAPAHVILAGKTVDQVAELIAGARRRPAP